MTLWFSLATNMEDLGILGIGLVTFWSYRNNRYLEYKIYKYVLMSHNFEQVGKESDNKERDVGIDNEEVEVEEADEDGECF